ncbi:MAG: carbohydrate ABC transporter permease [Actinobacteria bacterium]|nr:carbohydrate ABC transporter permease [Actinomycetota bacterium]
MSTSAFDDKNVSKAVAANPPGRTSVVQTTARATSRTRRRRRRRITGLDVLAVVFMIGLLAFAVIPMAWMFSTSLKSQFAAIQTPPRWIPAQPTLEAYRNLLSPESATGGRFLRFFMNSVLVSTTTTVIGLLVAIPAAYAFSRFRFPGRNLLFFAVLVRNMFPVVVFLIPLFLLMKQFGLINTYWSLILTYLTFGLPLSIWLLKGFYDNIPPELERAARIDGATRFRAFWSIVMPLSTSGIIATGIFTFIGAWNEYVYAATFLNNDRLKTLQPGLQKFFGEFSNNWPGLMAAQFVSSVPIVILFLVLQKYFVRALAEGATKA